MGGPSLNVRSVEMRGPFLNVRSVELRGPFLNVRSVEMRGSMVTNRLELSIHAFYVHAHFIAQSCKCGLSLANRLDFLLLTYVYTYTYVCM